MPRILKTALAALAVFIVGAPVCAAASWTAAATISSAHTFIGPLGLTQPNDSLVPWWNWQDGVSPNIHTGGSQVTLPNAATQFTSETKLPPNTVDLQGYLHTGLIAVTQSQVAQGTRTRPTVFRVGVATGHAGGSFKPLQTLAVTTTNYQPVLGVAANSGHAVVSYIQYQVSTHRRVVLASYREPSGRFSTPAVISGRGQADIVAAAAGDRGDLVVVFVRQGKLLARIRAAGHHWGSTQELARAVGPTHWAIQAAIDVRGRVEVVWHRYDKATSIHSLEAAYKPVGAGKFKAAQIVEPNFAGTPSQLAPVPGGWAVAYAVDDAAAGTSPATPRVRYLTPGPGPAMDAGPATGGLRDVRLAWSPVFGLFATWIVPTPSGDGGGRGMGAFAPSTTNTFLPPEAITPDEAVDEIEGTFEPIHGTPIAIWTARPYGTGPSVPVDQIRTVVRAAVRQN